jgi:hypothetical protein
VNKYFISVISGLLFMLALLPVSASASMQEEIDFLLNAVKTSDCVFIRNGSRHDPAEAVEHITRKYNYLKKRIKTTEDFIKGAATGSSMSGKPYLMLCDGVEMKSADWLQIKLEKYRTQ